MADSVASEGSADVPDAKSEQEQQLRAVVSDQLRDRLLERLRRTDGEQDSNCFIRPSSFREGMDDPLSEELANADIPDDDMEDIDLNSLSATERDLILRVNVPQRRDALEQLLRMRANQGTPISPKSPISPSNTMTRSADAAAGTAAAETSPKSPHFSMDSPRDAAVDSSCDTTCEEGGEAATPAKFTAAATSPAAASNRIAPVCTPREAQAGTPGSANSASQGPRGVNVMSPSDLDADEAESLQYEWQFEILNNMPREKAIALVDHLKRSEQERAQASAATAQLRREVRELEQQLQANGIQRDIQFAGSVSSKVRDTVRPRRRCRCLHGLLMLLLRVLAVALVAAAAGAVALHAAGVAPGSHFMDHLGSSGLLSTDSAQLRALAATAAAAADDALASFLPRGILKSNVNCGVHPVHEEVQPLRAQLEDSRRKFEACQAKLQGNHPAIGISASLSSRSSPREDDAVHKAAVQEISPREATSQDKPCDLETCNRISEEHKAMKAQLEMLQNDIDDALHKGRNTVCWPIT